MIIWWEMTLQTNAPQFFEGVRGLYLVQALREQLLRGSNHLSTTTLRIWPRLQQYQLAPC